MAFTINDGNRPSRLELDRRATGELSGEVPAAHQAALDAAKARVKPFDYEILRARSHRVEEDPPPEPAPSRPWWPRLLPLLAAAAALVLAVRVVLPEDPTTRPKGWAFLDTFVLQDGVGQPFQPGMVLAEGDRVQFAYNASDVGDTLVLLSIDGEGTLTVFWPAEGDVPVPIDPAGTRLLEDSIELDGARGPESFVVFFGVETVEEARSAAEDVYETAGPEGLSRLALREPSIDVVIIDKE